MKRPCMVCGTPTTRSRCPNHQIQRDRNLARKHLDTVYARDQATCQAHHCIEPSRQVDRTQATLGHIIPISKGGADTPTNLQLEHLRCNSAKNNRA